MPNHSFEKANENSSTIVHKRCKRAAYAACAPAVMTIARVDSVVEEGMTILSRVVFASRQQVGDGAR